MGACCCPWRRQPKNQPAVAAVRQQQDWGRQSSTSLPTPTRCPSAPHWQADGSNCQLSPGGTLRRRYPTYTAEVESEEEHSEQQGPEELPGEEFTAREWPREYW
eukprot:696817-Lingulodinium_polyedra.AAC.1